MASIAAVRSTGQATILCFLAAMLEGVDIQSMGVAAPKLAPALHLLPQHVGLALSASTVGLMVGAAVGGRLADRIGYRRVLIASLISLGIFSLATTQVFGLPSLLIARVLTGIGIGGVFPCLIALVSDAAQPARRATALSLMYAGLPAGGAVAGALAALLGANPDWRPIFYLGGFGPLLLVPFIVAFLREPAPITETTSSLPASPLGQALLGRRTASTLLLWTGYFFTLLVVYLLLNWLPSLLIAKGFSKPAGLAASMVFNFGAMIGSVALGALMDRGRTVPAVVVTYIGIALSLAALAALHGTVVFVAAFFSGVFASGGQLVLYALAPVYYPVADRGTGIGAAVAVGRLGSILGPVIAGTMLGAGLGPGFVLVAAIPGLVVAMVTVLALLRQPVAS